MGETLRASAGKSEVFRYDRRESYQRRKKGLLRQASRAGGRWSPRKTGNRKIGVAIKHRRGSFISPRGEPDKTFQSDCREGGRVSKEKNKLIRRTPIGGGGGGVWDL